MNHNIKCKYHDTMGDCCPQPICNNKFILGKIEGIGRVFNDGYVPPCPFKNTQEASVYCIKFESSAKYQIRLENVIIAGPFDSRPDAEDYINELEIVEFE